MRTIYIKGLKSFKRAIRKSLSKSNLVERLDYLEGSEGLEYVLIWVLREELQLRELKLAIGARTIFRHRLRFYSSVAELNPQTKDNKELTESERELMNRYLMRVVKKQIVA